MYIQTGDTNKKMYGFGRYLSTISTSSKVIKRLTHYGGALKKSKNNRRVKGNDDDSSLPDFPTLLRTLYKKVHPDLLRARSPIEADANDSSMKELNGVLSSIKVYNEYPPAMVKQISFYVKAPGTDELRKVSLTLRTAGGDCKRLLMSTFEDFFIRTGVHNGAFRWGADYFPKDPPPNAP